MSSRKMLIKVANWIVRKQNTLAKARKNLNGQKEFVRSQGIPRNQLERSYFQYKCQMKLAGKGLDFLYNIASIPMILACLMKYSKTQADRKSPNKVRAVFLGEGSAAVIPRSLHQEFGEIRQIADISGVIHKEDLALIKRILRCYPFSPFFLFKILLKMAQYNAVFECCRPEAVIVCSEFSYTSSFLTFFCHLKKVEHINVMHGEKTYYIRDAFFEFDRCYVWDEHYAKLFLSMMAAPGQFRIEIPPSLLYPAMEKPCVKVKDYTYYLQAEDRKQLKKIAGFLEAMKNRGLKVTYRPHPIYEHKETKKILKNISREEYKHISIEQSILETRYVIARTSTVLIQAYFNGVDIVLDDITDTEEFSALEEMGYFIVNKRHLLLSEVMRTFSHTESLLER